MIKKGDIIKLEIENFAFGGKGIGKVKELDKDFIVFVQHGIAGQLVNVKITKKKTAYAEAVIQEVLKRSKLEISSSYQEISGAPYINLPIEDQKNMKIHVTKDVFTRIGKLENSEIYFDNWIPSPYSHHYRNKMEYSFSSIGYDFKKEKVVDDCFSLGFKRKGTWWIVENLDADSGLFDKELESRLKEIRKYLEGTSLPRMKCTSHKKICYRYYNLQL